jgi:hypothetical protein
MDRPARQPRNRSGCNAPRPRGTDPHARDVHARGRPRDPDRRASASSLDVTAVPLEVARSVRPVSDAKCSRRRFRLVARRRRPPRRRLQGPPAALTTTTPYARQPHRRDPELTGPDDLTPLGPARTVGAVGRDIIRTLRDVLVVGGPPPRRRAMGGRARNSCSNSAHGRPAPSSTWTRATSALFEPSDAPASKRLRG